MYILEEINSLPIKIISFYGIFEDWFGFIFKLTNSKRTEKKKGINFIAAVS